MLISSSGKFKGEKGLPPFSLVISVEWLITPCFIKSSIGGFGQKKLVLKNTWRCIAEATVVVKVALIIWIIFWTETSDAKPLLLNALEPFTWHLGISWGDAWFLRHVRDAETEEVPAGLGSVAEGPQ